MHEKQPQSPAAVESASQSSDLSLLCAKEEPTSDLPPVSPYYAGTAQDPIVLDELPMSVANKQSSPEHGTPPPKLVNVLFI